MAELVSDSVRVERRDGGVAVITYDSPSNFNAFDASSIRAIRAAVEAQWADPEVRAIVFTGTGKVFCTGADVKAMKQAADEHAGGAFILAAIEELHPFMRDIAESPKPFIAAVNGVAAGGGLGLALAADARVGCAGSRFAAGYFGIGMPPDGGSTWFLPRLIGPQRTRRFFFENMVLSGDTALQWGLLDEFVDSDELLDRAVALASQWGKWSDLSRSATKRLLVAQATGDLTNQLEMERGFMAAGGGTLDFAEGVTAFVEKRAPAFQ